MLMIYFIVDDDPAICAILANLLENKMNAQIAGIETDGSKISANLLNSLNVDILLIDLLMPERDGIHTLEAIYPDYHGKTIMISQVETKEMIASAYERNIEAYITKPINNLEVTSVLKRVEKNIRLETSVKQIKSSLLIFDDHYSKAGAFEPPAEEKNNCCCEDVLTDLGIYYEKGAEDLMTLIQLLTKQERLDQASAPLKELWELITSHQKCGSYTAKDVKATEQRIRRAIQQSFNHICSLGALDITHPKFEHYAMKFFDLDQVQQKIYEINNPASTKYQQATMRLNIRRFISALCDECKYEAVH